MKKLYIFSIILSIILSPIYSLPDENPISEKTSTKFQSRITITGSASITVINNNNSSYGPKADNLITAQGGKIKSVIKEKNDILLDTQSKESDETLAKSATIDRINLPSKFIIEKAYPNPFNPVVNVRYGLPESASVKIVIHDIKGRMINNLSINNQPAGWHEYIWDGTDSNGQSIGTGVYLCTIQAGELIKKQKITFLK